MAGSRLHGVWQAVLPWILGPAPAISVEPSQFGLDGHHDLRGRYLRLGLWAGMACMVPVLLDRSMAWAERGTVVGLLAFSVACLAALRRTRATSRLGQWVSLGFAAGILAISVVQRDHGFPATLAAIPLLVTFATLVAGPATSFAVVVLAVATVGFAYLPPAAGSQPFMASNLVTWAVPTLMLQIVLWRLHRVLDQGTRELASSTAALQAIRHNSAELAHTLTDRIAKAVDGLAELVVTSPDSTAVEAKRISKMLDEARKGLPSEPELGPITLAERLSRLQVAVIDAMLALVGAASLLGFVHVAFFSPPSLAVRNLVQISTMLVLVALRILRPAWRRGLVLGCLLAFAVQLPGFISHWYALLPEASPNLTIVLLAAILAALTLSPVIGWLILAEFAVLTVFTLWEHPGTPWVVPVGLATAAGVWSWVIARWPRQLLALLHARHGEALDGLRDQRRMVATLFHDLANPLQVVIAQGEGVLRGSGAANPALIYTNRMREILAASQRRSPSLALHDVRALCDDLAVQFRGPLAKKNIRLDVACPPDTKVACDESQLRDSVLANLLSNAIKFSPTGAEITLSVEEDGARAVVCVADLGPGLPDSVRAAIAAGRRSPSQAGTAGEIGSGYGLLLAREYVVAMGGTLDFLPREGGGLVARITLPRGSAGVPVENRLSPAL